jgi:hypothetical protein
MNKEFVIWGIPKEEEEEVILYTKAKSLEEAKEMLDILQQPKYGCTQTRIQTIDLGVCPSLSFGEKLIN